jgi:hypothetical protein
LAATPFQVSTLGPEQEPWLELLTHGALPERDPGVPPPSYEIDPGWTPLLRDVEGWQAALQRGVGAVAAGDLETARAEFETSMRSRPNAWAARSLGALDVHAGHLGPATRWYAEAQLLAPTLLALTREHLDVLLRAGMSRRALDVIEALPADQRNDGRVRLCEVRAALDLDDLDRCEVAIGAGIEVADLREGETALSDVWQAYQAKLSCLRGTEPSSAVPPAMDFRMRPDGT